MPARIGNPVPVILLVLKDRPQDLAQRPMARLVDENRPQWLNRLRYVQVVTENQVLLA